MQVLVQFGDICASLKPESALWPLMRHSNAVHVHGHARARQNEERRTKGRKEKKKSKV